jgi:hypothetical protein
LIEFVKLSAKNLLTTIENSLETAYCLLNEDSIVEKIVGMTRILDF